jgi:hypothetical protein
MDAGGAVGGNSEQVRPPSPLFSLLLQLSSFCFTN